MAQNVEVLLANDERQHKYTRADFTAFLKKESAQWAAIIKERKLTAD